MVEVRISVGVEVRVEKIYKLKNHNIYLNGLSLSHLVLEKHLFSTTPFPSTTMNYYVTVTLFPGFDSYGRNIHIVVTRPVELVSTGSTELVLCRKLTLVIRPLECSK